MWHTNNISVSHHFVGQFRILNETFYLEEENSKLFIYKASDQPQSKKALKGN